MLSMKYYKSRSPGDGERAGVQFGNNTTAPVTHRPSKHGQGHCSRLKPGRKRKGNHGTKGLR